MKARPHDRHPSNRRSFYWYRFVDPDITEYRLWLDYAGQRYGIDVAFTALQMEYPRVVAIGLKDAKRKLRRYARRFMAEDEVWK